MLFIFAGNRRRKSPNRTPGGCSVGKKKKVNRRCSKTRVPWSEEEANAVLKHLGKYIFADKLPGKRAIDSCLKLEPVLKNRNWLLVKNYCRNKMESLKKH